MQRITISNYDTIENGRRATHQWMIGQQYFLANVIEIVLDTDKESNYRTSSL